MWTAPARCSIHDLFPNALGGRRPAANIGPWRRRFGPTGRGSASCTARRWVTGCARSPRGSASRRPASRACWASARPCSASSSAAAASRSGIRPCWPGCARSTGGGRRRSPPGIRGPSRSSSPTSRGCGGTGRARPAHRGRGPPRGGRAGAARGGRGGAAHDVPRGGGGAATGGPHRWGRLSAVAVVLAGNVESRVRLQSVAAATVSPAALAPRQAGPHGTAEGRGARGTRRRTEEDHPGRVRHPRG